jgi:hypothetical protein
MRSRLSALYDHLMLFLLLNTPLLLAVILLGVRPALGSRLGVFYVFNVALGYYLLPLILIVSLIALLLFPLRRLAQTLAAALAGGFLCFLVLDHLVYQVTRLHIDLFWLEFVFADYDGIGLPLSTLLTIVAILAAVVAVEIWLFRMAGRLRRRRFVVPAFVLVSVLAFAIGQAIHIVAYQRNIGAVTSFTPYLPLYFPMTSHKNAVKYGDLLHFAAGDSTGSGGQEIVSTLRYPLAEMRFAEPAGPTPNILVIMLESWRFDTMSPAISPRIHALAQESSVFEHHISSGNQTTCGIFGFFYGLHANYWSAVKANSEAIDNPVLIDALRARDYRFGIFARSKFYRHKIADTMFRGMEIHEVFAGRTVEDMDRDLADQVLAFIDERAAAAEPFLAYAFFKSTHLNYCYPPEHQVFTPSKNLNPAFVSADTDPAPYLNDYRNSVHYDDALIGEILDRLEALGELERTIVIVTTDHGEEFNDNGQNYWGHGSNFTQYQVRIPLIVRFPDREPCRVTRTTSHVDVVPTLMRDYFGCLNDFGDYSNGRDLFDEDPAPRPLIIGSYVNHAIVIGDDVFAITPVQTKRYKLTDIRLKAGKPSTELFNLGMAEMRRFDAGAGGPQGE